VQFFLDVPRTNTDTEIFSSSYKFVPSVGKYPSSQLVNDMNAGADAIGFPLRVSFTNGRFKLECMDTTPGQGIRVTDREYNDSDGVIPPEGTTYQGAQYGEATRFLNHLFIPLRETYLPYNIIGDSFDAENPSESTINLTNYTIGDVNLPSSPAPPQALVAGDYQFTLTFQLPEPGQRIGIYLQKNVNDASPGNVENWDIVENTTSYTFYGLQEDMTYRAAITIVGKYDETKLVYQSSPYVLTTGVTTTSFSVIYDSTTRDTLNKLSGFEFVSSNQVAIATQNLPELPAELIHRSQITSITIKFYINIVSFFLFAPGPFGPFFPPSLPSDARLEIESGGATLTGENTTYTVFDYMYWKTVKPSPDAFHQTTTVYASSASPGTSYGGVPLDWDDTVITTPEFLDQVFPEENGALKSRNTPNLKFFIGYPSNQLLTDGVIPAIYTYSIQYTV
jgi:hypothetical protein